MAKPFRFSKTSLERLATCHPDLQRLLHAAINHVDFTVACGHRNEAEQDEAVRTGASKTPWPDSKHNTYPSLAVDIYPCPVDFKEWAKDTRRFYMFVGFIRGMAAAIGIPIRCGADWDSDFTVKDQAFHDLPHVELVLAAP